MGDEADMSRDVMSWSQTYNETLMSETSLDNQEQCEECR